MNEFRGTNPQRHPQYLEQCGPLVLPPECNVTQPAPEVHVPSYDNVSHSDLRRFQGTCSCGWRGVVTMGKKTAKHHALQHAKENNGNVALDS